MSVVTFQQAGAKPPERGDVTEGVGCEIGEAPRTTPAGALTWTSSAERNRQLKHWRRAVFAIFGERPRVIRVAWVLTDLFNVKKGYAFPTNQYLAEATNMWVSHLREALLLLESGGAIIRANVTNPTTDQIQRVIYPAAAIIPRPALGHGGRSPTLGQRGEPQQAGHQNLRRTPRIQRSQMALAKADSARRDERKRHGERGPVSAPEPAHASVATSQRGYPSSEATRDRQGTRLTEEATVGMSRSTEDRQSSKLGTESAPDDGIPEFLRRKAKGAAGDCPRDAVGMASDRTIAEEDAEWML
jgi:hypothetical protein